MRIRFSQSVVWFLMVLAALTFLRPKNSIGTTLHVPSEYLTIQAAIDASLGGDTVLIADGVYKGEGNKHINFNGKSISVQSVNGPQTCIIDLEGEGRGFIFENGEGEDSVLSGITIQGGDASTYGPYENKGGAIYFGPSSPTIKNCIISSNQAGSGGGLYMGWGASPKITDTLVINNKSNSIGGGIFCQYDGSSPTIINTTIKNNQADKGAGLYLSSSEASISHSIISHNIASLNGGGIYCRNTTALNTITSSYITQNEADGAGGGIFADRASPTITNCVVSGNRATSGAGVHLTSSETTVTNCTFNANVASYQGGSIHYYSYYADRPQAVIKNSILWNNSPDEISAYSNGVPAVSYSNIKGGYEGVHNFHGDPLFVDAESGDYSLKPNSPCINTASSDGAPAEDIDGNLRPQGAGFDIGAYEMASANSNLPVIENFSADVSVGDIPFDVVFTCTAHDPEGGGIGYTMNYGDGGEPETNSTGIFAHRYGTIGIGDAFCTAETDSGAKANTKSITIVRHGIIRVSLDFPTIQAAIDATFDGNTIIVSDGIYTGEGNKNINLRGKKLVLKSKNGPENCIIDCEGSGRGFIFENGETQDTVISGFTIRNGVCLQDTRDVCGSAGGGGIYIATSSPSIENCILIQNTAESGGALYADESSAVIANCSFLENTANQDGGGMSLRDSAISLTNCNISGNTAGGYGGGIKSGYTRTPTSVTNCIISGNSAHYGGGIYASASAQLDVFTVKNSTITRNTSQNNGGGIYIGGGISLNISNSILWDNTLAEIRAGSYTNLDVTYSDVQGGFAGKGNFHGNPLFSNPESGFFTLTIGSPCIDAGTSTNAPDADIAGTPRPQGVAHDLGAYEAPNYAATRPVIDSFTADKHEGTIPFEVEFSCSAHDPDGQIAIYAINFDDGRPAESSSTGTFTHIYTTAGQSYATCTVLDDTGIPVNSSAIDIKRYGTMNVPSQHRTIQAAIDAQFEGGIVQVADGTYTGEGNKNIDFKGKALTLISENGPLETIIDCEGDGTGFIFQNAESEQTIVSGFTVTNGSGYEFESSTNGGAIFCKKASPKIDNFIIYDNTADNGGGIYCKYYASPKISNSAIITNLAENGGGLYCGKSSNPVISNSFIGVNGAYNRGGGIYIWESDPILTNNTIVHNASLLDGGGIYCTYYSSPTVTNSTISENFVLESTGGGIFCGYHSSITVLNSILWNDAPDEIVLFYNSDAVVSHSDIQGGFEGEGNISEDPKFADIENLEFNLTSGSPCIDAGNNSFVDTELMFDNDDEPRVVDGNSNGTATVDIGSDEFLDTDRDHLPDFLENVYCTSTLSADSDDDGIPDGVEDKNRNAVVDNGETDPCNNDTDGDGLPDGREDLNLNGVVDYGETDPTNDDTDGDGLPDGWEVDNGLDPLIGSGDNGGEGDMDADGLPNSWEFAHGLDPQDGSGENGGGGDIDQDGYSNLREYCSGTDPKSAASKPYPTTADAGPDQIVSEGARVRLNGMNSNNHSDHITSYEWTQIGGEKVKLSNPNAARPSFIAPQVDGDGEALTFQLTTSASCDMEVSSIDTSIVNVTWRNEPPVANAGPDQSVSESATAILDGSRSVDSDDGIATYLWSQISGKTVILTDNRISNPSFTAPVAGPGGEALMFQLTVTDTGGLKHTDTCIVNVTSDNVPPTAHAGMDQIVNEGETVTLTGLDSSDPDDGIMAYLWTQTNGIPVVLSKPTVPKPTFITPSVGTDGIDLTFQLIVTDIGGLRSSDSVSVTITGNGITHFPDHVLTLTSSNGKPIGLEETDGGGCIFLNPIEASLITGNANRPSDLIYDLFDLRIKAETIGGTVNLTFHLPEPVPEDYTWVKYSSTNGWSDFGANVVFNNDRDQVTLILVDGGAGDDDGIANGIIVDPSGPGVFPAISTSPSGPPNQGGGGGGGGGGCFIATAGYGSLTTQDNNALLYLCTLLLYLGLIVQFLRKKLKTLFYDLS